MHTEEFEGNASNPDVIIEVTCSQGKTAASGAALVKEQYELSEADERLIMDRIVHEFEDNE